jgi:hypothetical protein
VTVPVFGVDRDPGVVAAQAGKRLSGGQRHAAGNPCVVAFGKGPEGATCHDCVHLVLKHDHGARRYYGCEERGILTHGPATDHLVNWPACSHYAEGVSGTQP